MLSSSFVMSRAVQGSRRAVSTRRSMVCIWASSSWDQRLAAWGKATMSRSRQTHLFSSKSHRRTMSSSSAWENRWGVSSAEESVTVTVTFTVGWAAPSAWPSPRAGARKCCRNRRSSRTPTGCPGFSRGFRSAGIEWLP